MIILLWASLYIQVYALPAPDFKEFSIENLTIESGLSNKTITSIVQDREGYMWFGTESGLNRYDGYNFRIYKSEPDDMTSIPCDRVTCLLEDNDGIIWVGTSSGGVAYYNRENDNFKRVLLDQGNIESWGNNVLTSYIDKNGTLWFGTWGEGLYEYDKINGKFHKYKPIPDKPLDFGNRVMAIIEDGESNFLVGTRDGLYTFDRDEHTFKKFKIDIPEKSSASARAITCFHKDSSGDIWIGSFSGVFHFEVRTKKLRRPETEWAEKMKGTRVYSIREDKYDRLWFGSWNGLISVSSDRKEYKLYIGSARPGCALSSDLVLYIYIDRSYTFWVGTMKGLNMFSGSRTGFKNFDVRDFIKGDPVSYYFSAVYEDQNRNIWFGTLKNGVLKFNRDTFKIEKIKINNLADNIHVESSIFTIKRDLSGDLFIGTTRGLVVYDIKKKTSFLYLNEPGNRKSLCNNEVVSILEFKPGIVFIGTMQGLNIFDKKKGEFNCYHYDPSDHGSISSDLITSVLKDKKGRVWVGTYGGGLNRYLPETDDFERIEEPAENNLRRKFIYPLYESEDGMLWMGSNEGGLKMYDPETGKFRNYFIKDGLTSNTVWDVVEDNSGFIWFSSAGGISRLNREDDSILNFGKPDGILIDFFTFNSMKKIENGDIYCSGLNGFVTFSPREIKKCSAMPSIEFTSLKKLTKSGIKNIHIAKNKSIDFSHDDMMITFDFSAMSFLYSNKNRYKYKVSGISEQWIDLGKDHSVTFGSLDPGDYKFEVIGSNCFGVWNKESRAVDFKILPAYWQTLWFKLFIMAFLSVVLICFHITRLKKLEKKLRNETDMEKLFRKKKISKREKEILLLVIQGMTSREIEDLLFISYGTVKNHIYSIYKKLNVKNRAEIVNLFKEIKKF